MLTQIIDEREGAKREFDVKRIRTFFASGHHLVLFVIFRVFRLGEKFEIESVLGREHDNFVEV